MAFSVRDRATDQAVRELARIKGKGLTETIREAVTSELERVRSDTTWERIREIQERFRQNPETGLKADKEFYDSLNDE